MKTLQINDLPPDILTGDFTFKYEVILIDAATPEAYNADRLRVLRAIQRGSISVKYERIGPAPVSALDIDILAMLKKIETSLKGALRKEVTP